MLVHLGTGATSEAGGAIPVSATTNHTIVFRVTVDATVTNGQGLINAAVVTYRGQTFLQQASVEAPPVVSVVSSSALPTATAPTATLVDGSFTPAPSARTVRIPVLDGDSAADGGAVRVVALTDPAGGSVTLQDDGTVVYAPRDDFAGTDVFTYTIADDAGNRATASVPVTVVNGVPVAVADTVEALQGTPVGLAVLGNDTDADGDTLTAAPGTGPDHGTLTLDPDGTGTYTPDTGFSGTDSFTDTATDRYGDSAVATVTVLVDGPPVATDDVVTTPADTPVAIDVLANDTDPNVEAGVPGQVLSLSGIPVADHGATVTVQAGGTLTVTPARGYRGPVTVTYRVDDGAGGTATGILTVTVTVTVANAVPVAVPVAVRDVAVTGYRQAVEVAVLRNDTDANTGDVLRVAPGSLGTPVDAAGRAQGSVVLRDGILTYTPPTGFSGAVTFTDDVTDGTARATGAVSVTVRNAAPVAAVDVARVPAGTTVTIEYVLGDGQGGESTAVVTLEVLGRAVAGPTGLARTGAATGATAALAALLLATGTGLVLAGRRRRG